MNEYERGFIDGIKSKVSAELTPTLINVSKTMLEMLKPVLSTALENVLNDNNAITDTDVQPVKHGRWENEYLDDDIWWADCSNCKNETHSRFGRVSSYAFCPNCGERMIKEREKNE